MQADVALRGLSPFGTMTPTRLALVCTALLIGACSKAPDDTHTPAGQVNAGPGTPQAASPAQSASPAQAASTAQSKAPAKSASGPADKNGHLDDGIAWQKQDSEADID